MVFNFGGYFYQEASSMGLGLILPMLMAGIVYYYVGIGYDKSKKPLKTQFCFLEDLHS